MAFQGDSPIDQDGLSGASNDAVESSRLGQFCRRASDIIAASIGIMLFAPILFITALAIKIDSRGPIFIRETVYGSDNRAIRVLKFRFVEASSTEGARNNLRPTTVGIVLAHTGIDELPLLFNVLRGDLSIAGRQNVHPWPYT